MASYFLKLFSRNNSVDKIKLNLQGSGTCTYTSYMNSTATIDDVKNEWFLQTGISVDAIANIRYNGVEKNDIKNAEFKNGDNIYFKLKDDWETYGQHKCLLLY